MLIFLCFLPQHEYRIRAVDGTWKWHAARSVALRDSTGAIHLWISTIIEIQELILSRNEAVRIQNSISAVLMGAGESSYPESILR